MIDLSHMVILFSFPRNGLSMGIIWPMRCESLLGILEGFSSLSKKMTHG